MAARKSVDEKLDALDELMAASEPVEHVAGLAAALTDKSSRVIAKAARLAAERFHYDLVPDLVAAFRRLCLADKPAKVDPSCMAKNALARALVELDCTDAAFYLAGLSLRQPEPVWGGTVDTAADVRSSCAMGLVASGDRRALAAVTSLLFDPEAAARLGAVRAVVCGDPKQAELVLRAKILAGDAEPAVVGEAFSGLLSVAPEESVEFVAQFLDAGHATHAELAALALGESHLEAALEPLKAAWRDPLPRPGLRRALVRAAAAHRTEAALDWLTTILIDADVRTAAMVIETLEAFRHDKKLAAGVKSALERRANGELLERYVQLWRD